jgi:hypothetical protein
MNDRFKFRVWKKKQKKYWEIDGVDNHNVFINTWGSLFHFDMMLDQDDYVIEQCTGLTDKNGKLIYEGDVVIGSWNTKLIVFWDAISASYRVKPLDNCGGDRELHYYSNMDGISYYNYEIIGNIHEMEVEK